MVALDSSLGIEFGEEHLLLVHLKKLVRQVIVAGHAFMSLPAAMQEQEADLFLTQEVSRFVKEQKAGKENVWVSLPLKDCALRIITLPSSAEENLAKPMPHGAKH